MVDEKDQYTASFHYQWLDEHADAEGEIYNYGISTEEPTLETMPAERDGETPAVVIEIGSGANDVRLWVPANRINDLIGKLNEKAKELDS